MKTKIFKTFFTLGWVSLLFIITVNVLSGFVVLPEKSRYSATSYGEDIVPYSSEVVDVINFTSKEETYIETVKAVPMYVTIGNLPNACGPTAGATIVGFYDKYYPNLVPNYNTYVSSGAYKKADGTYIPQVMNSLYTLMRTNVTGDGVTEADCKSGLITYFNNQGYNLNLTNIASNGVVSESRYTAAINNNQPLLLFCDHLDMYLINLYSSTTDRLIVSDLNVPHVAVGYGFYTVKYYNGSTNFRTDKYLVVASGLTSGKVFVKIADTDWCDAAYVTTVS